MHYNIFIKKCNIYYFLVNDFLNHTAKEAFYDTEWDKQGFVDGLFPLDEELLEKPSELDEMTFTPASGCAPWNPPEANYKMGSLLQLPQM